MGIRLITSILALVSLALAARPQARSPITSFVYPIPQQIETIGESFALSDGTVVLVDEKAGDSDGFVARSLVAELSDRWGIAARIERVAQLPSGRPYVLIGNRGGRLVREALSNAGITFPQDAAVPEGYVLRADRNRVVVAGHDDRGTFYGFQSFRQLIRRESGRSAIPGIRIADWPHKPFRGIKVFLPGRENLAFFKRFLRDFMALYKFNTLVLEVNAGMRLDRHPEVNAGWIEFANDMNYSRRDRPKGPGNQFQDSAHHDTADGRVLEKDEVADLVRYSRQHQIEVIPEIPSLTHSYYLLSRHRELAEIQSAEWPDTYCPSNPESYKLLFDVLDEYADVMKPRMVHVGHDEWRMPVGVCERCKGKDSTELLIQDLEKIHSHLAQRGIRMAIWGDHLMESVRGRGPEPKVSPSGYRYRTPGALSPAQVAARIPKDILIFNWFWREPDPGDDDAIGGEKNDIQLSKWGFEQVYGNFSPEITNYPRRSSLQGVLGGAPSCWAVSSEFSIGKDRLYHFLGCANLLWSSHYPEMRDLPRIVQALMPGVRRNLSGRNLPSEDGGTVVPIAIKPMPALPPPARITGSCITGKVQGGPRIFEIPRSEAGARMLLVRSSAGKAGAGSAGFEVNQDVSSLIFLHAALEPAANDWVDRYVYNPPDTADLLGYYEVTYEDGLIETIPIRYQVNILEWSWASREKPGPYCYMAEAVDLSAGRKSEVTFFAYEWVNPRFGKIIREVRLHGSSGFVNTRGKPIPDNAVLLAAVSVAKPRPAK